MPREVFSLEPLGACALRGIQAEEARFSQLLREAERLYDQARALERDAQRERGKLLSAVAHDLLIAYPRGAEVRIVGTKLEVLWEGEPAFIPAEGEEEASPQEEPAESIA